MLFVISASYLYFKLCHVIIRHLKKHLCKSNNRESCLVKPMIDKLAVWFCFCVSSSPAGRRSPDADWSDEGERRCSRRVVLTDPRTASAEIQPDSHKRRDMRKLCTEKQICTCIHRHWYTCNIKNKILCGFSLKHFVKMCHSHYVKRTFETYFALFMARSLKQ